MIYKLLKQSRSLLYSLPLFFCSTACLQVQNSFEEDAKDYSYEAELDLSNPAQARLQQVRDIFVKYDCVGCHANRATGFKAFLSYSDSDWKASGRVVKGSATQSSLFNILRWSGCTPSANSCNMPQTGSMTTQDIATVREWIDQMP